MNKKGFAISTLLYPAFVIIITIVVLLLVALVNASFSISKLTNEISGDISDNNTMKSLKNNLKDALTETNSNRDVKYSAIAGSVYPVLNNNENTTNWNGNFYTKTDGTEMAYVNNNKYCAYKLAGMSGIAVYNSGECLKKIADQTNCAEIESLVTVGGGLLIINSSDVPTSEGALYQIDIISQFSINGYILSDHLPTSPSKGEVWFSTSSTGSKRLYGTNIDQGIDKVMQYNGSEWVVVGAFQYYDSKWNYIGQSTFAYDYTGNYQVFTAPVSGYYVFEGWGAQGGNSGSYSGGKGSYTTGRIFLNAYDKIYVYVGGTTTTRTGGYNGGGISSGGGESVNITNGGGGGATDFRLSISNINSRIMVAAGGGGAIYFSFNSTASNGSPGGNLSSTTTSSTWSNPYTQYGANQTKAGYMQNGTTIAGSGSFALGGSGADYCGSGCSFTGGGGGGGYYGGSSGYDYSYGGTGGSSYISGYTGCVAITSSTDITPKSGCTNGTTDINCSYHYSGKVFTNTNMVAGNASMPTHDGTSTMTGNSGNGYAKITYLGTTN